MHVPSVIPRLYIYHNHGTLVLANAVISDYGVAEGVCVGGGESARLFHAVLHRVYETGKPSARHLFGRTIRPRYNCSGYVNPGLRYECSPTPGCFEVDVCTCG